MIRVATDGYLTGTGIDTRAIATGGTLCLLRIPVPPVVVTAPTGGRKHKTILHYLDELEKNKRARLLREDEEILTIIQAITEYIQ